MAHFVRQGICKEKVLCDTKFAKVPILGGGERKDIRCVFRTACAVVNHDENRARERSKTS